MTYRPATEKQVQLARGLIAKRYGKNVLSRTVADIPELSWEADMSEQMDRPLDALETMDRRKVSRLIDVLKPTPRPPRPVISRTWRSAYALYSGPERAISRIYREHPDHDLVASTDDEDLISVLHGSCGVIDCPIEDVIKRLGYRLELLD